MHLFIYIYNKYWIVMPSDPIQHELHEQFTNKGVVIFSAFKIETFKTHIYINLSFFRSWVYVFHLNFKGFFYRYDWNIVENGTKHHNPKDVLLK